MAKNHKHFIPQFSFSDFLEKFPEVELPVSLTDDSLQEFSKNNDPLPSAMIQQFLAEDASDVESEFIEYIACCRIPQTFDIHAIVYWKADVMNYEYVLVTFEKNGKPIDKKVIAGTKIEQDMLVRSVATIDTDWIIYVVGGIVDKNRDNYEASTSQSLQLQLLTTGEIMPLTKAGFDE